MKKLRTALILAATLLGATVLTTPVRAVTALPELVAAGSVSVGSVSTVPAPGSTIQAPSSAEGQLLARLNQIRAAGVNCPERGPRPATAALRLAAPHAAAALRQASYMAQSGEVSHIGPGGTTPRVRAASSGIQTVSVTEIIYLGSRLDPEAAVQWWLHSPLHCSVMTDGRYTTAGASVVRGNRGTAYVMVLTSTPK